MLTEKMDLLKAELVTFAGLVEEMIEKSARGLLGRDRASLVSVTEHDEPRANSLEIEIDEMCTNIIAQYEPKARDLRTVLMILKMNPDLERMGDHAVNIAESSFYLIERPAVKPLIDIPRMVTEVTSMVRDAIRAFVNQDALLAKSVCERDAIVDGLHDQVQRELITYMTSDPTTIERAFHLIAISGDLERIADLSTNIGEDAIFMVEGRVIKHHREEQ